MSRIHKLLLKKMGRNPKSHMSRKIKKNKTMKKLIYRGLFLVTVGIGLLACNKQNDLPVQKSNNKILVIDEVNNSELLNSIIEDFNSLEKANPNWWARVKNGLKLIQEHIYLIIVNIQTLVVRVQVYVCVSEKLWEMKLIVTWLLLQTIN